MNRDKQCALNELMQLDFRLKDLHLYLDTHPTDQRAIDEFNKTASKAKLMRENFEKLYYPLTVNDKENNTCPWQWVKSPWPWENNENGGMK
ncbi:MAG: spore coat protein CotJB [Clostridia bacterium]|nr:spore coat protein CotJB [Clostridia bacterium]MBQ7076249.1 spore coat protein CotJB [Clostridia bacterium]